jgi:hypothetical protein
MMIGNCVPVTYVGFLGFGTEADKSVESHEDPDPN